MICVPIPCFGCSRLISVLLIFFWAWTLVDCYKHEPPGTADKYVWLAVIAVVPGFGAALYVVVRRPQRIARFGR